MLCLQLVNFGYASTSIGLIIRKRDARHTGNETMNVGSKRDSSDASVMMPFESGLLPEVRHRVSMTVSCRDTDSVP